MYQEILARDGCTDYLRLAPEFSQYLRTLDLRHVVSFRQKHDSTSDPEFDLYHMLNPAERHFTLENLILSVVFHHPVESLAQADSASAYLVKKYLTAKFSTQIVTYGVYKRDIKAYNMFSLAIQRIHPQATWQEISRYGAKQSDSSYHAMQFNQDFVTVKPIGANSVTGQKLIGTYQVSETVMIRPACLQLKIQIKHRDIAENSVAIGALLKKIDARAFLTD